MNKIYQIIILSYISFSALNCSTKDYVIYNAVKGQVFSLKDKKPVTDAKIYVIKGSFNYFRPIHTNNDGFFFINGLKLPHKYLHNQLNLSFNYFIEKKGYKLKVVTIKDLKKTANNKLDTINLKGIFLEEEKNISKQHD